MIATCIFISKQLELNTRSKKHFHTSTIKRTRVRELLILVLIASARSRHIFSLFLLLLLHFFLLLPPPQLRAPQTHQHFAGRSGPMNGPSSPNRRRRTPLLPLLISQTSNFRRRISSGNTQTFLGGESMRRRKKVYLYSDLFSRVSNPCYIKSSYKKFVT